VLIGLQLRLWASDAISAIAHDAITILDACIPQGFDNDVRYQLAHCIQTLLFPFLLQHTPSCRLGLALECEDLNPTAQTK
jgi:hypothetical protein